MKRILVTIAFVLMTTGTAIAHGGVNFQIGLGIPLFYPYNYPTYNYPTYYYPTPPVVYGYGPYYDPYYGSVIVHRGFGHRHFIERGGRFHDNHFRFDHGRHFRR